MYAAPTCLITKASLTETQNTSLTPRDRISSEHIDEWIKILQTDRQTTAVIHTVTAAAVP